LKMKLSFAINILFGAIILTNLYLEENALKTIWEHVSHFMKDHYKSYKQDLNITVITAEEYSDSLLSDTRKKLQPTSMGSKIGNPGVSALRQPLPEIPESQTQDTGGFLNSSLSTGTGRQ